ncbi:DUF6544 family protein [Rhodohalobacter barkolensis]|uniref:Uncharacterized protein n=1 Tax=Rhodohalobacter barkolensis TaxID=2053187 RepID=A0A2N0VIN2_9BACT|nr:DUF6544 family protein [Rhodohalobacter barkolensis]PKD44051.1 hypothetical protein CWD77_00810 [Rhodohalobacter barkolensis]
MLKILFYFIVVVHGLIHLLGFFKAFDIGNITQLTTSISKPIGILWLVASVLILLTVLMNLMNYRYWSVIAIIALVLSQIVIFTAWGDAKFGTIANLIILLVALPALGDRMFSDRVMKEQRNLLEHVSNPSDRVMQVEDFQHLPEVVQTWLKNSGVAGKPDVTFVRLKQSGEMKTEPEGSWMDFSAIQYFDVKNTSFNWKVDVKMMPLVTLTGRDKLQNGQGKMLIKLLSLVNVVNEKGSEQINTGSLTRFLGEICWFPSAALNENITWEEIDETSAKATLTTEDQQVSGIFRFGKNGEMKLFEADRYYGGAEDAEMQKWVVEAEEYKTFSGYRIPNRLSVTWKLPDGDFTWLKLEITDLDVNGLALYN